MEIVLRLYLLSATKQQNCVYINTYAQCNGVSGPKGYTQLWTWFNTG